MARRKAQAMVAKVFNIIDQHSAGVLSNNLDGPEPSKRLPP